MTRGKFITQVLDYTESTLTEVLTWTIFSGCSTELSQDVVLALFSSSHECCKAIGNMYPYLGDNDPSMLLAPRFSNRRPR